MTKTVQLKDLRGRIDFAIITVREDEFKAVLQRFSPRNPVGGGKQIYEYCRVRQADGCFSTVVIVRTFDQGQSIAQSVARDVIDDLDPHWLILVGIAGGVPDSEFSLGDVLLASSLHDFSVTAAFEGQQPQLRPSGGAMHAAVERLLGNLPAWHDRLGPWNQEAALGCHKPQVVVPDDIHSDCYYGSDSSREAVRGSLQRHFPVSGTTRLPLFKTGAVASSNVLLKDTLLLSRWQTAARHLSHVEMEAGGVYLAARHGGSRERPLLCIRGISDIVGFKRAPEWTQFACDVAASFVHALLTTLPPALFRDPSGEASSRREIAPSLSANRLRRLVNIGQQMLRDLLATGKGWVGLGNRTSTVEAIVDAFRKSSSSLLARVVDPSDWIPRVEITTLESVLSKDDRRIICVLGSPGSGKTALLALFAKHAINSGLVTLALKADTAPTELVVENWGQRMLGVDMSAADAVRIVSSRSKVVVVIDQLDALASTVDLTSDRLNRVVSFIEQCSVLPNVAVVCSCRAFEFHHDARFSSMDPKVISLSLPSWDDVAVQLTKHGVRGFATWPESFRELLRTPQHLRIYLDRYEATGKTDSFASYHLMLDDLWERVVDDSAERELLYSITAYLIDQEVLWAPLVKFEEHRTLIARLESKQILQLQDHTVGFRHQTLLEHAKARLFTKSDKSLCGFVLERQDAIFVRPTVWAVLRYLREASRAKYRVELEALFGAELRLHLRYLIIEFLGQQSGLEDYEIALLGDCLRTEEDRLRAMIAIRGNREWFEAFKSSHFPTLMQGPVTQQWPMIGIISDAWDFDRAACIALIKTNWLSDPDRDQVTWRAMNDLDRWDAEAVEMVCVIIRRAKGDAERLYWAEHLTSLISADQPQLAPRVFKETVLRIFGRSSDSTKSAHRLSSPLESSNMWYELPAVAEAAPLEFLRDGWAWLVMVCERFHVGPESSMLYEYKGWCSSLDAQSPRPESPIVAAFCAAIDMVAEQQPDEFVNITKESWSSDSAVLHRLLIRGLCRAVHVLPEIGLEYLLGDRRRFGVGTYENEHADSMALIRELVPLLNDRQRGQLEDAILSWSMYRDDADLIDDQKVWDREGRLQLLTSIPADLLLSKTRAFIEREKEALPEWNRERRPVRSGLVRQIPPMSKDQMLTLPTDAVVEAMRASGNVDHSNREWVEADGGWTEPGGAESAGHELVELAKDHPKRAIELIQAVAAAGQENIAAQAINHLSKTVLTDDELYDFVRTIASSNPHSEELRSSIGFLLSDRCKAPQGLPTDICETLELWLSMPWDSSYGILAKSDEQDDEGERDRPASILWAYRGGIVDTDRSFWPLLAVTYGYLLREPPETGQWLACVESHLKRDIAERTWAAYCSELARIRIKDCDVARGAAVVEELFSRFPKLIEHRDGILLVAQVSDLLPRLFLERFLASLRSSTKATTRQAFGELLTLMAFRKDDHPWASDLLNGELTALGDAARFEESIALGIAFASAQLWDEPLVRPEACRVLCQLIPNATAKLSEAIGTVFWAQENFAAGKETELLLKAFVEAPACFRWMSVVDLVEHLTALMPHERKMTLDVCKAIMRSGRQESDLFETGPNLVKIAMTLQRFSDTRAEGLSLLEDLLRLGLDDAFRILRDIDIRPNAPIGRAPRPRRRRRRPGS